MARLVYIGLYMIVLSDRGIVVLLWRLMNMYRTREITCALRLRKSRQNCENLAFVASPYL